MLFSQHKQRIISGLVLFALLCLGIGFGSYLIKLLVSLVTITALFEFYQLFYPENKAYIRKFIFIVFGCAIVLSPSFQWTSAIISVAFVCSALFFLFDYSSNNDENSFTNQSAFLLGLIYIPLILSLSFELSRFEQAYVILVAMVSDISAYYIGLRFGKHKVWPAISPKKSWEGSIASFVSCTIVTFVLGLVCNVYVSNTPSFLQFGVPSYSIFTWIILAMSLNLASQFGDFFESALKRSASVKDSGILIPGHGGILDRIDGVLFILPVYALIKHIYNFF